MNRVRVDAQEAIRLYDSGLTLAEVGVELGTTEKVIRKRLIQQGHPRRKAAKRNQWGENNHMWKGDEAGYASLHRRLEKRYGKPMVCSWCHTTEAREYNWANLTGKYTNLSDYVRLCRSCHAKYDGHGRWNVNQKRVKGRYAGKA